MSQPRARLLITGRPKGGKMRAKLIPPAGAEPLGTLADIAIPDGAQGLTAPKKRKCPPGTSIRPDYPELVSNKMDSEFGGPVNGQHKLKTYDPEVHPKLIYRLALCGLSADRMADCLLIDLNTLYRWRRDHEAFATAWHEGGDHADGKVANALFLRATGWEHMAEKIAIDAKDGNVVRVPYIERFAPDVSAINLWLTNRQAQKWKNKDTTEHTGPNGSALAAPTIVIQPVRSARQIATINGDASEVQIAIGTDDEVGG